MATVGLAVEAAEADGALNFCCEFVLVDAEAAADRDFDSGVAAGRGFEPRLDLVRRSGSMWTLRRPLASRRTWRALKAMAESSEKWARRTIVDSARPGASVVGMVTIWSCSKAAVM